MQAPTAPLLPPTHLIDAPGVYISPSDPAWDHPRCKDELDALKAKGAEAGRAAYLAHVGKAEDALTDVEQAELAEAIEAHARVEAGRHPVLRYVAGLSRYQLDAADWTPEGQPCTAREYLRADATPSTFLLVRPNRRRIRQVEAIDDTWERREAWIRAVVRRIEGPAGVMTWTPASDADDVPEAVLEAMSSWSPALIRQVADACANYCAPLRDHEKK